MREFVWQPCGPFDALNFYVNSFFAVRRAEPRAVHAAPGVGMANAEFRKKNGSATRRATGKVGQTYRTFLRHFVRDATALVGNRKYSRRTLCRRYEKEVEASGLDAFRFTPTPDVFAEIAQNSENECFCPAGPPCAPHGLFNVSLCQFGERARRSRHPLPPGSACTHPCLSLQILRS